MGKDKLYTAIDIGTTKVSTLVAKVAPDGSMELVATGHAASAGMRKGLVIDADELAESTRESVREAGAMLGSKTVPPAFVGITGTHLRGVNTSSAITRGENAGVVTSDDVDALLAETVKRGAEGRQRILHVIPRSYQIDSTIGIRNPVGLAGRRLSAESHVVFGDSAQIENVARVVRQAGVKVRGLIIEHLASAEAVLTAEERDIGVALVDIGGGTSDIAIYHDGALLHTAALPVAGHQFTNDIAIGLGLTPSMAEEAKVRHGSAVVRDEDRDRQVELLGMDGSQTRSVSVVAIQRLLHDRAVELVRMTLVKLHDAGFKRVPPGGIVFTGGSSKLRGLLDVARDYGAPTARLGLPSSALGIPTELQDGAFATGVGLLLWGIGHRHTGAVAPDLTIAPPVRERLRSLFSRIAPHRPSQAQA